MARRNKAGRLRTNRPIHELRRLIAESLEQRVLLAAVTGVQPVANTSNAPVGTDITATFDESLDAATVNAQTFTAYSMQTGRVIDASVGAAGNVATFSPASDLSPGDLIQATVTAGIQNSLGAAATPHVWQFHTAVPFGSGVFDDDGQGIGSSASISVALGDLDQDGDLDAFVGNASQGNRVWINQGGLFTDSGQSLGNHNTVSVALGDLDGDGDLDAFAANATDEGNRVWLNVAGTFSDSGQSLGVFDTFGVSLGDLDGDGDLDAFTANRLQGNRVWRNDGGAFTDSGQSLGTHDSYGISLGDLDEDGDLDAFVVNALAENRIWLNDGGIFTDSGQGLGMRESLAVSLGDLDADGDLDAFVANYYQGNRVWLNSGGVFSDSGQSLGSQRSYGVALGDLDGDGDLDAFVANSFQNNRVWFNDGGVFTESAQGLGDHESSSVALGDVDGDGDLDAFTANFNESNRVWINQNPTLSVVPDTLVAREGDTGPTAFTFLVNRQFDSRGTVSVDYTSASSGPEGAQASDFVAAAFPNGTLTFTDGVGTLPLTIEVAGDAFVESDEGFVVTLTNPIGRNAIIDTPFANAVIRNDDNVDLGDLPSPFPTLFSNDGAAHTASGPLLGLLRDTEVDGQPSADADGDDTDGSGDDEDGVTFDSLMFPGMLDAQVTVSASAIARLDAWIDFNGDQVLDPAREQIFTSELLAGGDNVLTFAIPPAARQGQTVARFRLSSAGGLAPAGGASDGEVEDHLLTIGPAFGSGVFGDSGQSLGDHSTNALTLGDLDGDGDLDVFSANGDNQGNRVWLNDGNQLTDSGQVLGDHSSSDVVLGDLDGDGDLDAFVANAGANKLWINDSGVFSDSGQALGDQNSYGAGLGDLDGDGDLDAFVANNSNEPNRVWVNENGIFSDSGQLLGNQSSRDVALGDLDGDGDLDAFVANNGQANRVWLNSGGRFGDAQQLIGSHNSFAVSLGDLDSDGDLDAFVANDAQGNRVWLNTVGLFADTGQSLGDHNSAAAVLGDVDGDGDLDALTVTDGHGQRVWINEGAVFTDSGQDLLGGLYGNDLALGDLDRDGDLDQVVALYGTGNRVVHDLANNSLMTIQAMDSSVAEGNEGTTSVRFMVTRTGDTSGASLVSYVVGGGATNPADVDDFGGTFPTGSVDFLAGETTQLITIDVTGDTSVENDEDFVVQLFSPTPSTTHVTTASARATITNDDAASVLLDLPASRDNTLYQTPDANSSLSNGSGEWIFAGRTGTMAPANTRIHRGLLHFDVSTSIPAGATVLNVTLTLNMDRTRSDNNDVSLHRVSADWGEGTSDAFGVEGRGTAPAANDATWFHTFFDGSTWNTPGGDFVEAASATTIVADVGLYEWSGPGLVADVQDWLDNGSEFGWVLRGEETLVQRAQRFGSRENTDPAKRPQLTIEYLPPAAVLDIAATDANKPEGNSGDTPFVFTVTRSGNTDQTTTVNFAVSGSGTNPADFADFGGTLPSGMLSFGPAETTKTISIDVAGDEDFEPEETFEVTLSSPSPANTQLATAIATGTIQNDEDPLPTVSLTVDLTEIVEDSGSSILTATLSEPASQQVTVRLGISGTAELGADFAVTSTEIEIPIGATFATSTITALQDALDEPDEVITVEITEAINAIPSGVQQRSVTILDDDDPLPPPMVMDVNPPANSHDASVGTNITVTFDQDINPATVSANTLQVHSTRRARLQSSASTVTTSGDTITLDPNLDLFPGEYVQATATSGIQGTTGQSAVPHVWQFRAGVTDGTSVFRDSEQMLGSANSYRVELGDLDGDGDLDALVANSGEGNAVWLNDGGMFTLGQTLSTHLSRAVALGDLDGDGDLDAFIANVTSANRVLINDGNGMLVDSSQVLGTSNSIGVSLGDVDGDGDLDALVANVNQGNRVWLNDSGAFVDSGQSMGDHASYDAALGDLDGDGDLDAFVVNRGQANRVWMNEGGIFSESGQQLGAGNSFAASLGDLDGDGDLDALVVNYGEGNRIWVNTDGVFADSAQSLGDHASTNIALGDLDGDGDLDAFVSNASQGNRVWRNAGGVFEDSNQQLGQHTSFGIALGDVDDDGDLDAVVANNNDGNRIWLNRNPTVNLSPSRIFAAEGDSVATGITFIVDRQFDTRGTASVDFQLSLDGANPAQLDDFVGTVLSSGTVTFTDGVASLPIVIEVAGDMLAEGDETFRVTISNPVGAQLGIDSADGVIRNDDNVDLGDLPSPFPTLLSDNGPAHLAVGPTLGSQRDIEPDGAPSGTAAGDDGDGLNDEDGVTFSSPIFAGQLDAQVTVVASGAAKVDAWIDFNNDGFLDKHEQILTAVDVAEGANLLTFSVPVESQQGEAVARFRLSTAGGLPPTGSASDGEVEDHTLSIGGPPGSGFFADGGQELASDTSLAIELGDLDADGDLDAFVANSGSGNRVWLNVDGGFTDSGQLLGDHASFDVALGDVDGDGDLDAFVSNFGQGNRVWLNSGGVFADSGQVLGDHISLGVTLGDLDGDGDLDALVANAGQTNRVWLNDGGEFTDAGMFLGINNSIAVALGDVDRDGDLDALVANSNQSNRLWLNIEGTLVDSGQLLGDHDSRDVALGDLDGDGDLDAFVANRYQGNRIWLNDGGVLTDSGQILGDHDSSSVSLGDLDGDGDLDAYVTNYQGSNHVWLNADGQFSDSGQRLGTNRSAGIALGDLDGDGDADAFVANDNQNRVWLNQNPTLSINPAVLPLPEGNVGTTSFSFSVARAFDSRGVASVDFVVAPSGNDPAEAGDFVGSVFPAGTVNFAAGVDSVPVVIEVIGDTETENDERFTVTLLNPMGMNHELGSAVAEGIIRNDDSLDLGDLPAPYPTLLADNGPAHVAVGPTLGIARDSEADGVPSAAAEGDDTAGLPDDEDGVSFGTLVFAGQLNARVSVVASAAAKLDAWIDFNGDGSFQDSGEQIFGNLDVARGHNELSFVVPSAARQGVTFARFRISSAGGLAPTGGANDGEVEDHVLTIGSPWGTGVFTDSGQLLGDHASLAVALGDLDGDGDLDGFVTNGYEQGNTVWLNDGGTFTGSGQTLGSDSSYHVALGDLDQDGDLDAFVANGYQSGNRIWLNDGGMFTDSGQMLGNHASYRVALGDLDGDGDLDAFVANGLQGNRVWQNDGGVFTDSGQSLGNYDSSALALGDLDGDGDLDAFVANYLAENRVWINDGGTFTDSGQLLGDHASLSMAMGDIDGDGDLDAVVGNRYEANRIWLNDGGEFVDSGQALGNHFTFSLALGDLDGDGDLDLFSGNGFGNRIWLNVEGSFTNSGQTLGDHTTLGLALGDLDADGDLDAFTANYNPAQPNRIWLDDGSHSLVAISATGAANPEGASGTTPFLFEVHRTGKTDVAADINYEVVGVGANPADAADFGGTLPSGTVSFAADQTVQEITIDVTGDGEVEPDEDFNVVLTGTAAVDTQIVSAVATGTILDDDAVNPSLTVTSLLPTSSGFSIQLSQPLNATLLNLHDTQAGGLGAADVSLIGAASGPVRGSIVVDASAQTVSFIKTGDPLGPDTYAVTLRSAENGFVSIGGLLLDGDSDGTGGDDYSSEFLVAAPPLNSVTVTLADFVRGPGQEVHVPANEVGLPLTISNGAGVRNVAVSIGYDIALLDITGATLGPNMPAGATVTVDTSSEGTAVVSIDSPVDLPAGTQTLARLIASVPTENANEIFRRQQVLDLREAAVTDSGANELPVVVDDALHVVAYFGDSSGNARLNASDASRVARVAALLDGGFGAFLLSDPVLIGDITGNGRLNAADASRVASAAALIPVDEIPPIPAGVVTAAAARVEADVPATEPVTVPAVFALPARREWGRDDDTAAGDTAEEWESLAWPFGPTGTAIDPPSLPRDQYEASVDAALDDDQLFDGLVLADELPQMTDLL